MACADFALENNLQVWLQPRLIDSNPTEMLAHLAQLAQAAERLRQGHEHITLNIGCELSVFMKDLIPGRSFLQRVAWLGRFWWLWMLVPRFNSRLNSHLQKAVSTTRTHFNGQITYSAGIWETIRWDTFDTVGLNYYREASNQGSYVQDLRRFHRYSKPIVITEFGCCSFDGADKLGGSGDSIVDYSGPAPVLKDFSQRNEQVQADYLIDLLQIYQNEGMTGAFVFEFTEPSHPHSSDPRRDLDMASYGLVKVLHDDAQHPDAPLRWEPKQAFHAIARAFDEG